MRLVDTHAHICDTIFDADREKVLQRAADVGVVSIIAVGENLADAEKKLQLASRYEQIRPAAGLDPANIPIVIYAISQLKGIGEEEIWETVLENNRNQYERVT